jgi:lysophospholipase L1-like esterase
MTTPPETRAITVGKLQRYRIAEWLAFGCMGALIACSSADSSGSAAGSTNLGGSGGAGGAVQSGGAGGGTAGAASYTGGAQGNGGSTVPEAGAGGVGQGGAGGTSVPDAGSAGGARIDAAGAGGSNRDSGRVDAGGSPNPDAGDFHPCPTDGNACKILPFGDSITFGTSTPASIPGGYRVELFTKAVMAGQKVTFVGDPRQANGPMTAAGMPFPRDNAGYPGFTIAQVTADNTFNPAFTTTPDIVLLHIGTNDIFGGNPQGMADRLSTLVDKVAMRAPNALVVVAKIIRLASGNVDPYNALIPGVVQAKVSQGKHIIVADLNGPMPMLSTDGIHPNQAGYNTMGDTWYAAISSYLPR